MTLKILVLIPSLHRGGAERVVSLLTQEWVKKHEVKLAVFDASNLAYAHGGDLIDLGLSAHKGYLGKGIQAIRRVIRLVFFFRSERADRIISFMESANFPCTLAATFTGMRSLLWVSVRNDPYHFSSIYKFFIPIFYRLPEKVVAVSNGVAQALAAMGVPKNKLINIPNPAPLNAPDLSVPVGKPIDAPEHYLLAVGRLHFQKGFDRLIEAFAQLDDKRLYLVILGEGKERNQLMEHAVALGVGNRLIMPGTQADVWPWYRNALCFVLSSRYEGWPNVIMEAMSQGCPVVASDCNYGPSEIIAHGVNGLLVAPDSLYELRDAINRLLQDEIMLKKFSEDGLRSIRGYSIDIIASKWVQ